MNMKHAGKNIKGKLTGLEEKKSMRHYLKITLGRASRKRTRFAVIERLVRMQAGDHELKQKIDTIVLITVPIL